ncbi:MAG: hypothetical protein OQK82_01915 [Candidatus Pacearchaeota archaeon]|nr:hypothetical protein [Candidatus Pacearchaeota archaeon]
MEIKFTDMDIVDTNIVFSKEYLTKARFSKDKERTLKLLLLARQSINNSINSLDSNIQIKNSSVARNIKKNLN